MRSIHSLLLLLLGVFCSISAQRTGGPSAYRQRKASRIVGGAPIDISERPFQVVVEWWDFFTCSGAILSPTWILTGARCVDFGTLPDEITIRAGTNFANSGGQFARASGITLHPNYDFQDLNFDVAVISLINSLQLGPNVAAIPVYDLEVPDGSMVTVSGWGITEDDDFPESLQSVQVELIDNEKCRQLHGNNRVTPDMVCAGSSGKDSCLDDDGGPLTYKDSDDIVYLIGAVSWGLWPCGDYPGVYSRLYYAPIREFIRQQTGV